VGFYLLTAQSETVRVTEIIQFDKFTCVWAIEHFSSLNAERHYSDIFTVGGHKWRLLIFPKGNNVDYLSIYLDVPDSATLPHGCSKYAEFSLAVVNLIDPQLTIKKETYHLFNNTQDSSDWGFTSFMSLLDVHNLTKGYLVDDTLIVEAEVCAQRVIDYEADDSRKQTGLDGLTNQEITGQSEVVSPSPSSEVNPLPEAVSPSRSSQDVGARLGENDYFDIHIQGSDCKGDPQKMPQKHKGGDGVGEGEAQNVRQKGVLPEAPRGKTMNEEQIMMVLGDITRGLVPADLEDPRWSSSAREIDRTFSLVVKLADEFKAMKEEVERLHTWVMTLSEAMKLLG